MENKNILLAANILFNHKLNKTGLNDLPKELMPNSIKEAYAIQNELKILYLSLNNNYTLGKKVGCTNALAQKQLNINEPFYGNLFSKFSDISGCKLKSSKFFKPYVESEISLRLKDDINVNDAPFCFEDSVDLFDNIFPSIEIIDLRFEKNINEIGVKNLISSNGVSDYYIQSLNTFALDQIDLNNHEVKLFFNDKIIANGNTNLVLKNPLNSAIWLLNKLADIGEPMLKGQIITTGSCTGAIKAEINTLIKADFGILGVVEFEYI